MNAIALAGAIEVGLIYGFVAIGVYLSFRVLDFPDLTADGSLPLGAGVAATAILSGWNPWLATIAAAIAGALAGLTTAVLVLRFRILGLLAGILTMTALYSINLRIMGRPNVALLQQHTVFDFAAGLGVTYPWITVATAAVLVASTVAGLAWFLSTERGLAIRATGVNSRMARAQGISTSATTATGLAISNALVAFGGALFAQANGFADVTSGIGTIVIGLASLILGETFFRSGTLSVLLAASVIGSIAYRLAVQFALSFDGLGLRAADLSLITACLVGAALILPRLRTSPRLWRPA